jgi:outer membrane biosynthesis protein TonB
MEDFDFFSEEEEAEEAPAEEGANRTFIILVGAMGGLLALGICAFLIWAFVVAPGMNASISDANESILATNTAIAALAAGEPTATETLEASPETPVLTNTPEPTEPPTTEPETPDVTPDETPEEGPPEATPREATVEPTSTATPGEVAQADTPTPTRTPRPTATRRPTATARSGNNDVPSTGVGAFGVSALAIGLLFLLVVVRRIRQTV